MKTQKRERFHVFLLRDNKVVIEAKVLGTPKSAAEFILHGMDYQVGPVIYEDEKAHVTIFKIIDSPHSLYTISVLHVSDDCSCGAYRDGYDVEDDEVAT